MTHINDLLLLSDTASGLATMATGRQRESLLRASSDHMRIVLDAHPVDPAITELSDDELLRELGA